jgi:hypothetical protein
LPPGQQLFVCNAAGNGWALVGDGAAGGVNVNPPLGGDGSSASPLYMAAANSSGNGYLAKTDWNTFNGKLAANGNGSQLTGLNPAALTSGTAGINITGSAAQLGGVAASGYAQLAASKNTFTGAISATSFTGDGTNVSNVNAVKLGGQSASSYATTAGNTFSGDQHVSGNVYSTNVITTAELNAGSTSVVDQAGANNGGSVPGLSFGGGGETIASNRIGSTNQYGLNFFTNYASRMSVTNSGRVGIGTQQPAAALDVNNGMIHIATAGAVPNVQGAYLGWNVTGGGGETDFINNQGLGGGGFHFINTPSSGTPSTTLATVDSAGIHAGPGMTSTPVAYGNFAGGDGSRISGSSNITCTWPSWFYRCTISNVFVDNTYVILVTPNVDPLSTIVIPTVSPDDLGDNSGMFDVFFNNLNGNTTQLSSDASFFLVVYKP